MAGQFKCLQLLVERGADVNLRNEDGNTALIIAAEYGRYDCVKYLIDHGANVNIRNFAGDSALIYAAKNGHYECLKKLFNQSTDVDISGDLATSLLYAAKYNYFSCVRYLVNCGAAANITLDGDGYSTVDYAIKNGNIDMFNYLFGVDELCSPESALLSSIRYGQLKILKYLIDHYGVDINYSDYELPLAQAVLHCQIECFLYLLDIHAEINVEMDDEPLIDYIRLDPRLSDAYDLWKVSSHLFIRYN
jgi:ankyrin repeat protein